MHGVRLAEDGHADYPHEPGTLYDCPPCERLMEDEMNHGRARRIASEWHAPHNECSALSHTGEITVYLRDELDTNIRIDARGDRVLIAELRWLQNYARQRGVGQYTGSTPWSKVWDDSPLESEDGE